MATCLVQQVQRKILTAMWWPASTLLTAYKMRYGKTGRPGVFTYGPIKMFPIPASAGVKHDHQGDHLSTAHPGPSPGLVARGMFLNGLSEFKTACVDEAENLSNFSGG